LRLSSSPAAFLSYSAVVDVLAHSSDPQVVADYIDSGKVVVYEVGKAMGEEQGWLAPQQKDYDAIKTRMGKKRWHGGTTIENLVNKSQHGQVLNPGESGLYQTFYKEASSLSHGDSYVFLTYELTSGWRLAYSKSERTRWGILGLSLSYQLLAASLYSVQETFDLALEKDFRMLIPALAALPN
jgi:hypothetical protein